MVVCLSVAAASPVASQDQGATVAAAVSATGMESTTTFSFSGSAGYQLMRVVAFEIEATAVPRVKLPLRAASPVPLASAPGGISSVSVLTAAYPGLVLQPTNGRAVIFTSNIRVQLPTPATRITPFFVAGGGVATVRRTVDITLPVLQLPRGVAIPVRPITQRVTTSATDLALTIGGGVDVRLAAEVAIFGDLRYFRLLADQDSNIGRGGAGVRYRF